MRMIQEFYTSEEAEGFQQGLAIFGESSTLVWSDSKHMWVVEWDHAAVEMSFLQRPEDFFTSPKESKVMEEAEQELKRQAEIGGF